MLFYQHGLLCATYPFAYIFGVITINLFMCYPLLKLPLPGNAPLQFITPTEGYSVPPAATRLEELSSESGAKRPRWYFGSPVAYIQQIVVRAAIIPWDSSHLINSDLLRSSLFTTFELLEHIDNYQLQNNITRTISLADVCLRVAEVVGDNKDDGLLPEYNCLALSPARFWRQDKQRFLADKDLIGTMFRKRGMLFDTPPSVRDILFGVPWVKKYHLSRRRRVISYAVTIALRDYNHQFLTGLQEKLETLYPQSFASNVSQIEHLVHIHYHGHNFIVEYTPLIFAYIVLFLYLYFSVRKIEMVKSKWGLALSAMVTVVASLLMSVSLCLFFGLTPSLSGSEIFPYLVVIIGLENNLVITKSVVTTPVHLEVKLRIAQGLQKEGWYIFKNLVTELLVLAFGFLTFVPAIQEFCLFAVLALGSDFFLQMFFFATVLSVDIRRMELSDLHRPSMHEAVSIEFKGQGDAHCPVMGRLYPSAMPSGMNGSLKPIQPLQLDADSSLKLVPPSPSPMSALEICDDFFYMDLDDERLPRRMRLLHFWARYRILQRGIMICVLIWIFLIVFKTGLVEELDEINPIYLNKDLDMFSLNSFTSTLEHQKSGGENITDYSNMFVDGATAGRSLKSEVNRSSPGLSNVFQDGSEQWRYLSSNHWLTLLSYYNISLSGRYLTILPSIHLSIGVSPEEAIGIRHPSETRFDPPQHLPSWDPTGQFTIEPNQSSSLIQRLVRYPRTKTELVITILLGIASFFLLVFIMLSMYKCMCSRNYAKWRSSWQRRLRKANQYYKQIRESVPLVLNGHIQEVECIITDGQRIVSSCLGGEIRVWDFGSGECLVAIDRAKVAAKRQAALFRTGRRHSSTQSDGVDQPSAEAAASSSLSSSRSFAISVPAGRSCNPPTSLSSSFGSDDLQPVDQARHHSRHRSVDFALASIIPDLTETIDTDFKNSARNRQEQDRPYSCSSGADETRPDSAGDAPPSSKQRLLSNGYDFTHFESYFAEHRKMKQEEERYVLRKRMKQRNSSSKDDFAGTSPECHDNDTDVADYPEAEDSSTGDHVYVEVPAAIWCLACDANIIVAGCGNGTVEFWDACTGNLRCMYQQSKSGVIGICLSGSRVIAARIDGTLDFLQYFSSIQGTGNAPTSTLHRSSLSEELQRAAFSESHCALSVSVKAHQQSINMISARGRYVLTASQDHTLKVYRIDDGLCQFTLHGHAAPVTTLYIDAELSCGVVSGSADASVRVWNIEVGTCIHKLSGHTGGVTSVVCSSAHVVSVGMDDRLCIWGRSKGHLIHCVQLEAGYCNTVAMLTRHLIITGGQGSLHLWDVHKGRLLRALSLGDHDASVFIRQLLVIDNSVVVCDFGSQLRVVQFTPVLEKDD